MSDDLTLVIFYTLEYFFFFIEVSKKFLSFQVVGVCSVRFHINGLSLRLEPVN